MILSPSGGSIGLGFAIPAETVKSVVEQLKFRGTVTRGWIGIQTQPVTPALAGVLGLPGTGGALVADSQVDGPANTAGIVSGDVITSINGEIVRDNRDLNRKIINTTPGTSVSLGIIHDEKAKKVDVTLGEVPWTRDASVVPHRAQRVATSELGWRLAPAASLPYEAPQGVVVIGIDPTGRAADLGLEAGDVIMDVSGNSVRTPEDVRNALSEVRVAGRPAALVRVKSGTTTKFVAVPVDSA
jgi:serine protease Do